MKEINQTTVSSLLTIFECETNIYIIKEGHQNFKKRDS